MDISTPTTTISTTAKTTTTVDGNIRAKWVDNLSSTTLAGAQETILPKGPNFAMVPKCSPKEQYIANVEYAYLNSLQRGSRIEDWNQLLIKKQLPPT